jgi:putative ABC transport system substrate-binding protein
MDMRRREFLRILGGAVAACPLAARAQQPAMPVIGYLGASSPMRNERFNAAFLLSLKEAGFIEGQNVAIEYRWADDHYDRLPALAADLVRRQVTAIVAFTHLAAVVAKAATTTIPIAFTTARDPVATGLVASLNRPGGNMTGATFMGTELSSKGLGLLRELVPNAKVIAVLVNPDNSNAEPLVRQVQEVARELGLQVHVLSARSDVEFDAVFASFVKQRADALVVATDPLLITHRDQLTALAARHSVPTVFSLREFVVAGGLLSYGTDLADAYRQVGIYIARILKGTKPADLPVIQPTKFELVINLRTAKALGLTVPSGVLAIADEVIE